MMARQRRNAALMTVRPIIRANLASRTRRALRFRIEDGRNSLVSGFMVVGGGGGDVEVGLRESGIVCTLEASRRIANSPLGMTSIDDPPRTRTRRLVVPMSTLPPPPFRTSKALEVNTLFPSSSHATTPTSAEGIGGGAPTRMRECAPRSHFPTH